MPEYILFYFIIILLKTLFGFSFSNVVRIFGLHFETVKKKKKKKERKKKKTMHIFKHFAADLRLSLICDVAFVRKEKVRFCSKGSYQYLKHFCVTSMD